jgi:hypothetical protein
MAKIAKIPFTCPGSVLRHKVGSEIMSAIALKLFWLDGL